MKNIGSTLVLGLLFCLVMSGCSSKPAAPAKKATAETTVEAGGPSVAEAHQSRKVDLEVRARWEKALAPVLPGLSWEHLKAMSYVRPGVSRQQLIDQLTLCGAGGWSETDDNAGNPVSCIYQLDADWQLNVNFAPGEMVETARIEPQIHFGSGNLRDLKDEIPEKQFELVETLNQAPCAQGDGFDPAALVRAVNTLHAAGYDQSIAALETYLKLCGKDWQRNREYGLDSEKLFFIMRLLFVRKDGNAQMPDMAMGAGDVNPPSDPATFPLFPLAVESDVPFMLVSGYCLAGMATPASLHLAYVKENCRLRNQPMMPSVTPEQAMQKLTASAGFKMLFLGSEHANARWGSQASVIANLRRQALRAVSNLHSFPFGDRYYLDPDPHGRQSTANEALWNSEVNTLEKLQIHWDPAQMSFQAATGATASVRTILQGQIIGRWRHVVLPEDNEWGAVGCTTLQFRPNGEVTVGNLLNKGPREGRHSETSSFTLSGDRLQAAALDDVGSFTLTIDGNVLRMKDSGGKVVVFVREW